jgi:hypothetical protein
MGSIPSHSWHPRPLLTRRRAVVCVVGVGLGLGPREWLTAQATPDAYGCNYSRPNHPCRFFDNGKPWARLSLPPSLLARARVNRSLVPFGKAGSLAGTKGILLFEMHDLRGILHSSFGFEGERGGLGGSPIRELSYIMAGSPQSLLCPPPALICDVYFFLSKLMYCSQLKLLPLQHPSAVEVFSCLLSNSPYVA